MFSELPPSARRKPLPPSLEPSRAEAWSRDAPPPAQQRQPLTCLWRWVGQRKSQTDERRADSCVCVRPMQSRRARS